MLKTASVTDLRKNISAYLDELSEDGALMVLRNSSPAAYLLSPDAYEQLLDRLEKIEDIRDSLAALQDYKEGKGIVDADELFKKLGL
ncbi:MAG: type II toxin-antitoxin system Phd/YefM family antitoxin [Anaerolineales bacterium]|nr:type II toxin-antitoxin system Phd/YefM family antitoxin [Anaerolineales bacterium]